MSERSPPLGIAAGAGLSVLLHGVAAAAIALYGFGPGGEKPELPAFSVSLAIESADDEAREEPTSVVAPAVVETPAASPPPPMPAAAMRPSPAPPRAKPEKVAALAPPSADPPPSSGSAVSVVESPAPTEVPSIGTVDPATGHGTLAALGAGALGAGSAPRTPKLLHAPTPDYPQIARRRGQQGRVVLAVELDPEGLPVEARVLAGSGFEALDRAALAAVKAWRFDKSDEARRAVEVPIVFRLGE